MGQPFTPSGGGQLQSLQTNPKTVQRDHPLRGRDQEGRRRPRVSSRPSCAATSPPRRSRSPRARRRGTSRRSSRSPCSRHAKEKSELAAQSFARLRDRGDVGLHRRQDLAPPEADRVRHRAARPSRHAHPGGDRPAAADRERQGHPGQRAPPRPAEHQLEPRGRRGAAAHRPAGPQHGEAAPLPRRAGRAPRARPAALGEEHVGDQPAQRARRRSARRAAARCARRRMRSTRCCAGGPRRSRPEARDVVEGKTRRRRRPRLRGGAPRRGHDPRDPRVRRPDRRRRRLTRATRPSSAPAAVDDPRVVRARARAQRRRRRRDRDGLRPLPRRGLRRHLRDGGRQPDGSRRARGLVAPGRARRGRLREGEPARERRGLEADPAQPLPRQRGPLAPHQDRLRLLARRRLAGRLHRALARLRSGGSTSTASTAATASPTTSSCT